MPWDSFSILDFPFYLRNFPTSAHMKAGGALPLPDRRMIWGPVLPGHEPEIVIWYVVGPSKAVC